MFKDSNATCQLMFSWSDSPNVTASNITFGLPFFRQYGVGIDYVSQQLTFLNQTIQTTQILGEPTAQQNEHGAFIGIVAFVIVLVSLAGFGFIAWLIWFIHQKMHARDMNWSSESGAAALETA